MFALASGACTDASTGADPDATTDTSSGDTSGDPSDSASDATAPADVSDASGDPGEAHTVDPDIAGPETVDQDTSDTALPDTDLADTDLPDAATGDSDATDGAADAVADVEPGDAADAGGDAHDEDATDEPDADDAADDDIQEDTEDPDADDTDTDDPEPIDCTVTDWTPWSACSASCGEGIQTRTRSVIDEPSEGRDPCPPLIEVLPCNPGPCPPVDCVVTEWTTWSPCTALCGGGTQRRTRDVLVEPAFDGAACPALEQEQACNVAPCPPVDCVVSDWTSWSPCTALCGGGTQRRTRDVLVEPASGGAACPALEQQQACNVAPCPPVDCVVSEWTPWTPCSAFCGGGVTTRTRTVEREPAHGGAACPALDESSVCNTQPCPPPTWVVGPWGPCEENLQRRSLTCQDLGGRVVADELCTASRPSDTRACNT